MSKNLKLGKKNEEDVRSKLTDFYIALFAISAIVSLASLFYIPQDLYSIWTFQVSDPPWLPPGYSPTEIIGPHTFGDFQLPYTLALDSNPYSWSFYNATMPLGFILYSFLTILPIKIATFIFLMGGLLFFGKTLKEYFGVYSNSRSYTYIFLFFSLPVLICLDRGGSQFIALTFMFKGLGLYNVKSKIGPKSGEIVKIIYLAIAVSLKIYLIIPVVLVLIVEKKVFEFIKKFLAIFISANFILSFLYGGPLRVIRGLIQGYLFQTGESDPGWIFGGVSLSKFLASLFFYNHTFSETMNFAESYQSYVFIPGVLYILFIFALVLRQQFSKNYKISIILSTVFLVTPVSGAYTLIVTSFMIAIIFGDLHQFYSFNLRTKIRYLTLVLVIFMSMMPIPSKYYLTVIPGLWVFHFLVLVILAVYDKGILIIRKPL